MNWELQTAFVLGALHSLEPGHGKTAMVAMMLDSKKKWWDSIALAISLVTSHSALIFLIAILTHFGGHLFFGGQTDKIMLEGLKAIGSLALLGIGLYLILSSKKLHSNCCGKKSKEGGNNKNLPILLGISIGLFPCPSLVATFLASISTGHLSLGVKAVCLFSLGSFLSVLSVAFFLRWLGNKMVDGLESKLSWINWKMIQGIVIFSVGGLSFFMH